jgi:hypothetical protein
MTKQQRADLHHEMAELRAELRREIGDIRQRLDLLERPKVAKVIFPPRTEPGGAA